MREFPEKSDWIATRRDFLKVSGLFAAGCSCGSMPADAGGGLRISRMRFGIFTDAHYADADPRNNRYYRESSKKMAECIAWMNRERIDFLAELGDLKDQDNPCVETNTLGYLKKIEGLFQKFKGNRYHVLGNHDMDSISKKQFLEAVENTNIPSGSSHYSFAHRTIHFIVLDANFTAGGADYDRGDFDWRDTHIPRRQLDWLENDLASASRPVIVFVHQRLDGEGDHFVKNASGVRQIMQKRRNVLAVFQGHDHAGDYRNVEGIHYYTLKAMVEGTGESNSAYAVVEVHEDFSLTVTGYRKALSRMLEKA